MSWISSRKKACDKCGKRMLLCDVVNIEGMSIDLCVPCAKSFMEDFKIWKEKKELEKEERTIEVSSNLPYVNCTVCGALIMPCIVGFSEQLRDAKICMECMEKRVLKAIKGVM